MPQGSMDRIACAQAIRLRLGQGRPGLQHLAERRNAVVHPPLRHLRNGPRGPHGAPRQRPGGQRDLGLVVIGSHPQHGRLQRTVQGIVGSGKQLLRGAFLR